MSIHYLHVILLSLVMIIVVRVSLDIKQISDFQQVKTCITFNHPSAKTSIRPICAVEPSALSDHCFSTLSYLKHQDQMMQSCGKYLSHVTTFKDSIRHVQPQDFITRLQPRPEDQFKHIDLPYYYSSKDEEINRIKNIIQATDIHYINVSNAQDRQFFYNRCNADPSNYTNINQARNPDPSKAADCHEYANFPYWYGVSYRSSTDNLVDFTIDIQTDQPLTLALDNSDYVNWQLTGKTYNVKAIFVLNNRKATLDKQINLHHIYALRTFKNICLQCKGLQFENADFERYARLEGSNEEFEVLKGRHFSEQSFSEHYKSNAKSITIK